MKEEITPLDGQEKTTHLQKIQEKTTHLNLDTKPVKERITHPHGRERATPPVWPRGVQYSLYWLSLPMHNTDTHVGGKYLQPDLCAAYRSRKTQHERYSPYVSCSARLSLP